MITLYIIFSTWKKQNKSRRVNILLKGIVFCFCFSKSQHEHSSSLLCSHVVKSWGFWVRVSGSNPCSAAYVLCDPRQVTKFSDLPSFLYLFSLGWQSAAEPSSTFSFRSSWLKGAPSYVSFSFWDQWVVKACPSHGVFQFRLSRKRYC